MATGRTVSRWFKFQIYDSGATLRDINIVTIAAFGPNYTEVDLTAANDPVGNALPGMPVVKIAITARFDNKAATAASGSGAAPAFSGTHTVLSGINGLSVPLTLGIYYGIQKYWSTGDPVFGLAQSATSGFLCRNYQVNGVDIAADFIVFPGSSIPAWGTAALA